MDTAVVIVADKINTAKDDVSKISQSWAINFIDSRQEVAIF